MSQGPVVEDGEPQDVLLVVDDDVNLRTATERVLKRAGYSVILSGDGDEALRIVREQSPSAIVCDLRMPGMDGLSFMRRLQAQGSFLPVVLSSGFGTIDDVVEAMRYGAVDYLKKPWTPPDLLAAVARAVAAQARRASATPAETKAAGATPSAASVATTKSEPPAPAAAPSTFATVLERVKRGELAVPVAPAVAIELRTLMQDSKVTLERITLLLERDPHLTVEVLRVANGVLHRGIGRISSLNVAVTRLGMKQLQDLIETVFARRLFQVPPGDIRNLVAQIWAFSVTRAVFMRAIADQSHGPARIDPGAAYVAGLLCDSGASFLLRVLSESEGRSGDFASRIEFVKRHHAAVGGRILSAWKLDDTLVRLVAAHHDSDPPAPPNPFWHVCALASSLTEELLGRADGTRPSDVVTRDRAKLLEDLALTPIAVDQMRKRLEDQIAALVSTFE